MSSKSSIQAVSSIATALNPTLMSGRPLHGLRSVPEPTTIESLPNVEVSFDPAGRTLWTFMRPDGRPSFSPPLLRDLRTIQHRIHAVADATGGSLPFRYVVVGSRVPGIFNLGGDLALFAEKIMQKDREGLRRYAHGCVDVVFANADGYGHFVTSVALVQGDALGGGFEAALSCNIIVAEKHAKFGLPEILFNLFPGMGAYTLLTRRIGARMAEKMILSGQTYSAADLHDMGIIDVLAEPGDGEATVREHLARLDRRYNAHEAILRTRQLVNPVSHQELRDVTDIWVDAAMRLTESDLRKMLRLVNAQNRRIQSDEPASAAG
ncbi:MULTISPECIES: crotonase/enoyl-CoA hydratase family protein [Nguyenibacter]|uniref:Crotonase/enoyl-CoA hydratase family protein n=1 Tax=Nguyenibacter vanlangensis TaxID=1216886 RepID=A0A7Y7IYH7_9PROT|nr:MULTISPECIES: crotonase/enoyl-CoA hydratase family protein [Nguyenibacter]NVN12358.1 crotonase/enoyl-CoA hydratase family protein [Nguyenibacter vanlangensis]WRH87414.1 crotonase/enoyl-CoA hydratase family protein [Nguyenibacter sp. L1]